MEVFQARLWQDGVGHEEKKMHPQHLCHALHQQTACLLKGHLIETNYGKSGAAIMPPEHPDWQRWLYLLETLAEFYGFRPWGLLSLTGKKYVERLKDQASAQKEDLKQAWQHAVDHHDKSAIVALAEQLFGQTDIPIQWMDLAVEMAELCAAVEGERHDSHNGIADEMGDVFFSWLRLHQYAIVHHSKPFSVDGMGSRP